jgi:hypothetical protein
MPKPTAGPLLVGCPRLLTAYIRSYPRTMGPILNPQTEDCQTTTILTFSNRKSLPEIGKKKKKKKSGSGRIDTKSQRSVGRIDVSGNTMLKSFKIKRGVKN